ncbi:uncharacterized protein LOC130670566 [Microplitis mediator]|uniref:uncharacterized protein LOC130670566 n=1 Tax=Microplitis mediator TaxID=375433 RepID=UPI002554ECAF|nr:uncharacterized protein LOC130670566 [Microplitis mediator]
MEMMSVQKYPQLITGNSKKDDNKILMCYICSVKEKWLDHKMSSGHVSRLHYFSIYFEDSPGDFMKCKLCKNFIPKGSVEKHANKKHQLITWHKPAEKFVLYFKNFIKPINGMYYCRVCARKYKNWDSLLTHIDQELHKKCLKDYFGEENINGSALSPDFCKKLVTNCIFPYEFSQLQCLVCNITIGQYNTAEKHIADEIHKNNLSSKKVDKMVLLKKSINSLFAELKISESADTGNCVGGTSNSNSESCASTSSGYSSHFNTRDYLISDDICDGDHSSTSIKSKKSLPPIKNKIPKRIDDVYWHRHYLLQYQLSEAKKIKSTENKSVVKVKNKIDEESEGNNLADNKSSLLELENQYIETFKNRVLILNSRYCFCNLCKKNFSSSIMMHINDSVHQKRFKKKVKDENIFAELVNTPNFCELLIKSNIFQNDCSSFYCHTCKCDVHGSNNVESHINGLKHKTHCKELFSIDDKAVSIRADQQILPSLPETKDHFVKYFENYILKHSNYYYCYLCKIHLSSSYLTTHLEDVAHKNLVTRKREKIPSIIKPTLYFCELCVRTGVFQDGLSSLKCFECECLLESNQRIGEHINDKTHKTKLELKISSIEAKIKQETIPPQSELISNHKSVITDIQLSKSKSISADLIIDKITPIKQNVISNKKVTPVYELESQIITCFKNYIFVYSEDCFCNLCEIKFSSSIMIHINDPVHQERFKKKVKDENIFAELVNTPNFCELLIKSNIFQNDCLSVYCYTCKCPVLPYNNVESHINGLKHKKNCNKLFSIDDTAVSIRADQQILPSLPETKDHFVKYFENYILKHCNYYYCYLCKIHLSSSYVTTHLEDVAHKNLVARKREKIPSIIKSTLYFCELCVRTGVFQDGFSSLKCFECECLLESNQRIGEHINDKTHKTKLELKISSIEAKIKQETIPPQSKLISNHKSVITDIQLSKSKSISVDLIIDKITPIKQNVISNKKVTPEYELEDQIIKYFKNYIFVYNEDYFCNLCKIKFSSSSSILSHLNAANHKNLLTKKQEIVGDQVPYLPNFIELLISNNIFQLDPIALQCFTCRCSITAKKCAEQHIGGQLHRDNHKFMLTSTKINALPSVTSKQSILSESTVDFVRYFKNFIEKRRDNYYCHLCHSNLSLLGVKKHIQEFNHCNLVSKRNLISNFITKTESGPMLYFYELFVRNSIYQFSPNELKCFTCGIIFPSTKDAELHTGIKNHKLKLGLASVETSIEQKTVLPQPQLDTAAPPYNKEPKTNLTSASISSINDKKITKDSIEVFTQIDNMKKFALISEQESQFLKYFENNIFICDNNYYCNLCEKKFFSSVLMLSHINELEHKNRLKEKKEKQNIAQLKVLPTPNFYELLVRNNIFQLNPLAFKCLSCDRSISGYICAEEHISGRQHKGNQTITCSKIKMLDPIKSTSKNSSVVKFLPESKKNFSMYFENFIEKRLKDYYCHLCFVNCSSSDAVIKHMSTEGHQSLVKKQHLDIKIIKKNKSNFYYSELCVRNGIFGFNISEFKCFGCKSIFVSIREIEGHVDSNEHKKKQELVPDTTVFLKQVTVLPQSPVISNNSNNNKSVIITPVKEEKETSSLPKSSEQFLKYLNNYILVNESDYFCNLCNITSSEKEIMKHIDDKNHQKKIIFQRKDMNIVSTTLKKKSYEKAVKNNIFPTDFEKVNCFSCCNFFKPSNLHEHISGRKHKRSHRQFKIPSPVKQTTKLPQILSVSDKKSVGTESKSVSKSTSSKNTKNTSNVLSREIYNYNDTKNGFLRCHVCREPKLSRNILHVHLSSHFWQLFTNKTINDLIALGNLNSSVIVNLNKSKTFGQVIPSIASERREVLLNDKKLKMEKSDYKKLSLNDEPVDKDKKKRKKNNKKEKKLWVNNEADEIPLKNDEYQPNQKRNRIQLKHVDIYDSEAPKKMDIYKMDEELSYSLQLSLNRICIITKDKIYCMVCRKKVPFSLQIVYEHFRSVEHSYFLMQMVQDHMKFEGLPNEFSDLHLAGEMMVDKSDRHVVCYACDSVKHVVIPNKTDAIEDHINQRRHRDEKNKLKNNLRKFISDFNSRLEYSWYKAQRYWCVVCSVQFKHEKRFYKHLDSSTHQKKCAKFVKSENFVCDICPTCGILFYGFKNTFTYHANCRFHKYYADKSFYLITRLPTAAEKLLINADQVMTIKLEELDEEAETMRKNEQLLLDDLKNTTNDYIDVKIHPFGSRITGLGSKNSDLDIFLDCDDLYYKGTVSDDISYYLKEVEHSLKKNESIWTIQRVVTDCRVPIIKLVHQPTGIDCDLSFTSGLTTENTKLIKMYLDKYPLCKKIILFIKDWINICNLSGEDGISSYAIAWMVIYYLQTKFILPSVADLIKLEGKSSVVGSWETGVSKDFTLSDISNNYSFRNLLNGFFTMCAGFDYRNNIFCPLLGRPIRKLDFIVPASLKNLPIEMLPYVNYIQNNKSVKYFHTDSMMGIQDPFDLSNNLTKSVKKSTMLRFRTYCSMSADELNSRSHLKQEKHSIVSDSNCEVNNSHRKMISVIATEQVFYQYFNNFGIPNHRPILIASATSVEPRPNLWTPERIFNYPSPATSSQSANCRFISWESARTEVECKSLIPLHAKSKEKKEFSSNAFQQNIYHYNDAKKSAEHCNICGKRLESRVELHVHLSSHFWKLFTDDDIKDLKSLVNLDSVIIMDFSDGKIGNDQVIPHAISERKERPLTRNDSMYMNSKKLEKTMQCKTQNEKRRKIKFEDLDGDQNDIEKEIDIYKIDEELCHSIQLSLNRICIINKEEIYCMVCREKVTFSLRIVYEHFRSVQHSYFLMQMVQDNMKFKSVPNELSDLHLAREMIEDKSNRHVVCYVCDPVKPFLIPNSIDALKIHIKLFKHKDKMNKLKNNLRQFISDFNLRLEYSWYNAQSYWCVVCSEQFKHENRFYKHLNSSTHQKKCAKFVTTENFVCNFCSTCGILLYGFKNSFTYHANCQFHKYYADRSSYLITRLPTAAEELLINADQVMTTKLEELDEVAETMRKKEQLLLDDLKNTTSNYIDVKIHPYGSRITGLGSMNSDLDIFLDCDDLYYKGAGSDDILYYLKEVEHSLKQNESIWTIQSVITDCRVPIIKLVHRPTGIDCDLSFSSGLTTENTKLIKMYVDKYPTCRKLILFIKDWINICNLSGEDGISSYAIAWMVIYYLQTRFIVPSVADLIKLEGNSCMIRGWETGVSEDMSDISDDSSFKNLLRGFFVMCAGFDYRNNIFCPLLGCPIRKVDFIVPASLTNLPVEMLPYKKYMLKHKNAQGFRADAVMGIQDPFELSHNLTKAVKKLKLYRFKTYCSKSINKLNDN